VIGYGIVMTREMSDRGEAKAHEQNMTADLQTCQSDLIYQAGFAGGRFTQNSAASTVAKCLVTPGTVLTVRVNADGRNFSLVATNEAAPNIKVIADSTADGGRAHVTAIGV
jgi:hypothetical protein